MTDVVTGASKVRRPEQGSRSTYLRDESVRGTAECGSRVGHVQKVAGRSVSRDKGVAAAVHRDVFPAVTATAAKNKTTKATLPNRSPWQRTRPDHRLRLSRTPRCSGNPSTPCTP